MTLVLLALFVLLSAGDLATTIYGLRHGYDEGWALPSLVFRSLPRIPAMIAMKLLYAAILWWALHVHLTGPWDAFRWGVIGVLFIGGSAYAVASNVKTLRQG